MDHVELGGGVLAREGEDRELAARMVLEEVRDVEHAVVEHDPAVGLGAVARNLGSTLPARVTQFKVFSFRG